MKLKHILLWSSIFAPGVSLGASAPYPYSTFVTDITFDMETQRNTAPGNGARAPESDNWTITWADDGNQYTSFGDGNGFSHTGDYCVSGATQCISGLRASMGVARIEGGKNNYSAVDLWQSDCGGKSLGILSIDATLYLIRSGNGSTSGSFLQTELYKSINHGDTWELTEVEWYDNHGDFPLTDGFFSPTFLQFGQGYAGARDEYVYIYAPEETSSVTTDAWEVQSPGRITLIRVPKNQIENEAAYEYYAGPDGGTSNPAWTSDITQRTAAFLDSENGVMRTSVSYNAGLQRYFLITQQVSRQRVTDYHIGIYEAPEPWGPWSTVLLENANVPGPGLMDNSASKTVYWNFSNKWLSADGRDFVLVYTGRDADEWGTVEGSFTIAGPSDTIPPAPPSGLSVTLELTAAVGF